MNSNHQWTVSKSPNRRTVSWHWICALPYITDSVTWMCFTDCWSVLRGETWMHRLLDFVGQDRRLKNGTCNKAGFWSVPHFLLLRWVLIHFDPFKCSMHKQSVHLYHDMSLYVCNVMYVSPEAVSRVTPHWDRIHWFLVKCYITPSEYNLSMHRTEATSAQHEDLFGEVEKTHY